MRLRVLTVPEPGESRARLASRKPSERRSTAVKAARTTDSPHRVWVLISGGILAANRLVRSAGGDSTKAGCSMAVSDPVPAAVLPLFEALSRSPDPVFVTDRRN